MYIYIGIVLYLPSLSIFIYDWVLFYFETLHVRYIIEFYSPVVKNCHLTRFSNWLKYIVRSICLIQFRLYALSRHSFFHADKIIFNHQENLILCNILRRQTLEEKNPNRIHVNRDQDVNIRVLS